MIFDRHCLDLVEETSYLTLSQTLARQICQRFEDGVAEGLMLLCSNMPHLQQLGLLKPRVLMKEL
jgi:hypothetical protein